MTGPVVRDRDGNRYLLEKRSQDTSRVWDPETGKHCHLPNEQLQREDGSALQLRAKAIPGQAPIRDRIADPNALGLVAELEANGPIAVRTMLSRYELCESDLHGVMGELRAANLIEEVTVAGERGYGVTETASEALEE